MLVLKINTSLNASGTIIKNSDPIPSIVLDFQNKTQTHHGLVSCSVNEAQFCYL